MPWQSHRTLLFFIVTAFTLCSGICSAELSSKAFSLSVDTPEHNHISADDIDTIINSNKFTPLEGNDSSFGGSPWLKVRWDKSKITDEKYLINDFTAQAYEDYYLIKDNKVIASYAAGFAERFDARPITHYKFVVDVNDADYVLIKTCCNPGLPIYLRLLNETELTHDYYYNLIWYIVVYSLVTMMLVYHLYIYFYSREKRYLHYCYYLLSTLLIILTLSGIGKQFLWPNLKYAETFYLISSVNIAIANMSFQLAFLNQQYLTSFNKKLMYYTIGLHLLALSTYGFALFVPEMYRITITVVQLVCMFGWIITDYVIIRNIMAGDRWAIVLLFSYLLMNVSALIYVLRYNGLIPDIGWTAYTVEFAVIVESILISFALAQIIQKIKTEKVQLQEVQFAEQKRFSQQLLQVQEEEKKALGSALHDNFTHQLLVLKNNMANKVGSDADETQQIDKVLNDMRNLSHLIHPYTLEKLGLKEAVIQIIEKTADTYALDINYAIDDIPLTKQQSLMVFRIIQESLNNIVKHADASECLIAIKQNKEMAEIFIKDDGKGFDVHSKQGLGITTIKERCSMLQGKLEITSDSDGSCLKISFSYK